MDEIVEHFNTLELKPGTAAEAEASKFYDYYESKGWVVGNKSKMKNWRAAASGWSKRDFSKKVNSRSNYIANESDYNQK